MGRSPLGRQGVAAVLAVGLSLSATGPAAAWSDQGHMATGDIAYDTLKAERPEAVAAILAIMSRHPDRAKFEARLAGLSGVARERRMFALMARWPDDARNGPFDRPKWHYSLRLVTPWGWALPITVGGASKAYRQNLALASDVHAPAEQRAVALCWVMHIVGDMHQPLHAGHWLSARFPKSDRGGTIAWVKTAPGAAPIDLHETWDRAADRPLPVEAGADALAAAAKAAHPRAAAPAEPAAPGAAFRSWARQSRALARSVAYLHGRLLTGRSPAEAPVMSKAYLEGAKGVAETRIASAGYRLADQLGSLR